MAVDLNTSQGGASLVVPVEEPEGKEENSVPTEISDLGEIEKNHRGRRRRNGNVVNDDEVNGIATVEVVTDTWSEDSSLDIADVDLGRCSVLS